jgi:putative nucleotidyltransferase with HDIG domain
MSESVMLQNIRSALCVPLIQHGQIIGIIYLDVLGRTKAFRDADLELLVALAGPASMQIQNALYMKRLNRSYWDTIQVLAQAVDARDPYTIGHNLRVSRFAVAAATFMAWPEEKVHLVELAGILHDIGKIGISDTILLKKGPLSKAESRDMKRHPEIGAKMISGIEFLQPVIPFILYHHEMWDGNGYPYGLKGTDIPEEGRLMAVCDAFDAMLTSRPYRKGLKPESALQELVRKKNQQFDPEFVQALMSSWDPDLINQFPLGKGKERFFLSRSETNLVIPSIGIKS